MRAETLLPLGKLDPGLAAPAAALDVTTMAAQAQEVQELGYYSLVLEETKDDPFMLLALAAQATAGLRLGTSVAIAFARSPFVTAMSAWTLQKVSRGRFELGLGSQVRAHIQRRFGQQWHAPGPWMRDYVGAVRAIWQSWQNQTPINYDSDRYQLDLTVPLFTPSPIEHPDIPVLLAAVNPYMCRVAGEVANGVRLHPVCAPRYIENVVLPAVAQGQRLSGRPAQGFDVCLKPLIASARNQEELQPRIQIARERLAFYLSTPAYRGAFEAHDLGDLAREASLLARSQRWGELAALVDDDMLHEWVVVATFDDLADTIQQRYGAFLQRIEVSVPIESPTDRATLAAVVTELNGNSP